MKREWQADPSKLAEKIAKHNAGNDYVKNIDALAERCGVSRETLYALREQGLILPVKTKNGYNWEEFKKRFSDFNNRSIDNNQKHELSPKERKTQLECDRLMVNIKIDDERLKQAEIETLARKGEVMPVSDFRRALDEVRGILLGGIDQLIETASTKLRSAKVRAVLESEARGLRERLSARGIDAGK